MLSLTATKKEGGLIVTPKNHTNNGWDVRITQDAVMARRMPLHTQWPAGVTPRLHYHQSGWLNIEPQGLARKVERPSVMLTPTRLVTGKQVFSVIFTHPEHLPTVALDGAYGRPGGRDTWIHYWHHGMPTAVAIIGVLYPNIVAPWWRNELLDDQTPFFAIRNTLGSVEHAYSLVGHGIDSFLMIRFNYDLPENMLDDEVVQASISPPAVTLAGFCALREWPSGGIYATTRDAFTNIYLLERSDLPRFEPFPKNEKIWARARITRDATSNAIITREKL